MKGNRFLGIGLLLVGIAAVVFAILCGTWASNVQSYVSWCDYVSFETYGGDAYTGIQNAAAETANNLVGLNRSLVFMGRMMLNCVALLFWIIAAILIIVGITKIYEATQYYYVYDRTSIAKGVASAYNKTAEVKVSPITRPDNHYLNKSSVHKSERAGYYNECPKCGKPKSPYAVICSHCGEIFK